MAFHIIDGDRRAVTDFLDHPAKLLRPEVPLFDVEVLIDQLLEHTFVYRIDTVPGSCPTAWCSFGGVIAAFAGTGRVGQAATAGNPTIGSSLNGAIVSSVM
jgi:hypothetical protein